MSVPLLRENVNVSRSRPGSWPVVPFLVAAHESSAPVERFERRGVPGNGGTLMLLLLIGAPHDDCVTK